MFITDGIESDYVREKEIFEQYNSDKSTRVFTYLVGRKKSPNKEALVTMACENNGFFYKLETLGLYFHNNKGSKTTFRVKIGGNRGEILTGSLLLTLLD